MSKEMFYYKGIYGTVNWCDINSKWFGRLLDTDDYFISYQGKDKSSLRKNFEYEVDNYFKEEYYDNESNH